jgi:serine/threonine protein kinase
MREILDALLAQTSDVDAAFVEMHLRRMPFDYLERAAPAEIARHIHLLHSLSDSQLVDVDVRPLAGSAYEVCVVGHDRTGVLAAITTALATDGFDVQDLRLATYRPAPDGSNEPTFFIDTARVVTKWAGLTPADMSRVLRRRLGLAFKHLADGDLVAAQTAASDSQWTVNDNRQHARATADAVAVKEGMVLDGFRLEQKLATGGMSEVFLATQLSLNRKAAVKLVSGDSLSDGDLVSRFGDEAQIIAGFNCPQIVQVYASGTKALANGMPLRWMALEYLPSGDVAAWLKNHGPPSLETGVRWLEQALLGLSYAHRRGIVHRDLKPHNFLLTAEGDLKITDFGLFKQKRSHPHPSGGKGVVVGTPHYTSPEQAVAAEADERSDIYSLGVSFFHIFSGRLAFEEQSVARVIVRISQEEVPCLLETNPETPRPLAVMINRMTCLRPEDRYQSAHVALEDLRSYLERGLLKSLDPETSLGSKSDSWFATPATMMFSPEANDDRDDILE